MDFIRENITFAITSFTLLSNILFILFFVLFLSSNSFRQKTYTVVNKNILGFLFVTSLGALVGSLTYSNIAGFPPCELCWIQRIFMYQQVILSFMAMIKKDKGIVFYLFPLSILGAIVSFYHSMAQWGFGGSLLPCTAVGGECSKVYVLEYGYITIPFMAFTSFIYLIAISAIYFKSRKVEV